MYGESIDNHFIGREREIARFSDWLDNSSASTMLYFHDAAEEPERKGGIGKTYLLRHCADLARRRPGIAVVTADFFNVGDRDGVFLTERILDGLLRLFPGWTPDAFQAVLSGFRSKTFAAEEETLQIRSLLTTELARDLQRLEVPVHETRTLLVFLDTFETIEQNPELAVLRPGQIFPDTYQLPFIRFVIAGRNRLDNKHRNWQGRELEVVSVSVEPFDRQEMMEYIEAEVVSRIPTEEQQITILYERTEGRPILIGLVTDVLNHRILTLEKLLSVQQPLFEQYLVEQINFLENPLNWVILSLAHVYHRFDLDMWEHILHHVELTESVREISSEELSKTLPQLSFVRQTSFGKSFVLHDEMQRLVSRYCWPKHDIDLRVRKAISRCMIEYYERELQTLNSERERQTTIIELLYHTMYIDTIAGLAYLQEQIQQAQRLRRLNFARLLLLEANKFRSTISLVHQNTLQLREAQILRLEENPASIQVIETLEKQADPLWMKQNRTDFLFEAGRCYFERSFLKEAWEYFLGALEVVQDDEQLKAFILSFLGGISRKQGQFSEAVRFCEQSTAILKALGDRFNYASSLTTVGSVMALQGRYEEAMRRCKIALQIREDLFAQKEASELPIGQSLTNLGIIYLRSDNILDAEKCFKQASDIYSRTNFKTGIATLYNHFGNLDLRRGDIEAAQHWFLRGEQASLDVSKEQYINSSNKLGRVCLEQSQVQKASFYFQRAIKLARELPDYFQLVESLIDLARVMEQTEKEDEAEALLQQAEAIAAREQYRNLYAAIELIRAETALYQRRYSEAFRHFEQHCYYAFQHTLSSYNIAVRSTTDALLTVPAAEQSRIVQQLIDNWTSRGLAESRPELIAACKEVQEWSME